MTQWVWRESPDDAPIATTRRRLIAAFGAIVTSLAGWPAGAVEARMAGSAGRTRCRKRDGGKRCARVRVGYQCSPGPGPGTSLRNGPGGGNARLTQVLVPRRSGRIEHVRLRTGKDANTNGDYLLQLARVDEFGAPTNQVIAVARIPNQQVPVGISLLTFTFPGRVKVRANRPLALVLTRPGGEQVNWEFRSPGVCTGQAFTSPGPTSPYASEAASDFVLKLLVASKR